MGPREFWVEGLGEAFVELDSRKQALGGFLVRFWRSWGGDGGLTLASEEFSLSDY